MKTTRTGADKNGSKQERTFESNQSKGIIYGTSIFEGNRVF